MAPQCSGHSVLLRQPKMSSPEAPSEAGKAVMAWCSPTVGSLLCSPYRRAQVLHCMVAESSDSCGVLGPAGTVPGPAALGNASSCWIHSRLLACSQHPGCCIMLHRRNHWQLSCWLSFQSAPTQRKL